MTSKVGASTAMLLIGFTVPTDGWAWGAIGHEWISGIAIEKLPEEIPSFVRTPEAAAEIAVMGRELDRSKGAGRTHDAERDSGHYVNLSDDGSVVGVLAMDALPITREDYDTLLREKGYTQYKAGYLPYSIVDGWEQIRKDFAYWRADVKGAETATDPAQRAWFEADRKLREKLTLRDIGIWSHYVGDASQPLHVSVHFNGWGDFPNPNGFATAKTLHAHFEGAFVRENLDRTAVASSVVPYQDCGCPIQVHARTYILATLAHVIPLYTLEQQGAFKNGDPRGIEFAAARLAAAAHMTGDMIIDAWRASADAMVGYPMVNVRDIESGRITLSREMFSAD